MADPSWTRDRLRAMPVFASLDERGFEWLAAHVHERAFEAGERLIEQGADDRDCYLLVEGEVDIEIDGRPAGRCGTNDPEGELALLYGPPRRATVTAARPVRTLVLPAADFDGARAHAPDVAAAISRALRRFLGTRFGHPSAPA